MKVIEHPQSFKEGTRVMMLKGRHKDGLTDERCILRVSHDATEFDRKMKDLVFSAQPGERIYASAGARNVAAAVRLFKQRQLDADYDEDCLAFYRSLNSRWCSCLSSPQAQQEKFWLFDCDAPSDEARVLVEYYEAVFIGSHYAYASKSGRHVVVKPFDKSKLRAGTRALLHENAIMLWGFA